MFDLEFRLVNAFGLVGLLLAWMVIWLLVILIRTTAFKAAEEAGGVSDDGRIAYGKFRRIWNRLMLPVMGLIVLVWLFAMVFIGWKAAPTIDEPPGVLEPQGQLQYEPKNSPDIAGERVMNEGKELQKEGYKDLQEWRQNFFNEGVTDEKVDGTESSGGDAERLRDGGPTREESDLDASER